MKVEEAKQELIKRYRYLYENALFILAPYMYEQSQEEYQETLRTIHKQSKLISAPLIYLKLNRLDSIVPIFEEFLLSAQHIEESKLYQLTEENKNDKEYLAKVKQWIALVTKKNKAETYFKEKLNIGNILKVVGDYIEEQSGDLTNKKNKLFVLDEYYRLYRYKNDGKVYTSGRNLNLHDCGYISIRMQNHIATRDRKDIGVTKNPFIIAVNKIPLYEYNSSIFMESEKQRIYLDYHDELPCDLEIDCNLEIKNAEPNKILKRPENTTSCGKPFTIKKEEIFVGPNNQYYQLCPHCGFIVNIPSNIISDGIKKRINERCQKDDKLFRKMYLYSELFSLDRQSTQEQKKLLKNNR